MGVEGRKEGRKEGGEHISIISFQQKFSKWDRCLQEDVERRAVNDDVSSWKDSEELRRDDPRFALETTGCAFFSEGREGEGERDTVANVSHFPLCYE